MRRVVITGMGICSSIGNDCNEVLESLRQGRSGIERNEEYAELGFRSQVWGPIRLTPAELIDRKLLRFMGNAAAYAYIAMQQAMADARLSKADLDNPRIGLIAGSGGGSSENQIATADLLREKGVRRVGPYMVPRTMTNTVSACLATANGIKGVNYSIGSACATSAHCIGNAAELIQLGKQDVVFAGGGDEIHWGSTVMFDAMGALSSKYNDTPGRASRPYDADRDGFVISGGGGILVLEELEHAQQRGATIYGELVGYGATSDGVDMVAPSGEGAVRCMRQALAECDAGGLVGPGTAIVRAAQAKGAGHGARGGFEGGRGGGRQAVDEPGNAAHRSGFLAGRMPENKLITAMAAAACHHAGGDEPEFRDAADHRVGPRHLEGKAAQPVVEIDHHVHAAGQRDIAAQRAHRCTGADQVGRMQGDHRRPRHGAALIDAFHRMPVPADPALIVVEGDEVSPAGRNR